MILQGDGGRMRVRLQISNFEKTLCSKKVIYCPQFSFPAGN